MISGGQGTTERADDESKRALWSASGWSLNDRWLNAMLGEMNSGTRLIAMPVDGDIAQPSLMGNS